MFTTKNLTLSDFPMQALPPLDQSEEQIQFEPPIPTNLDDPSQSIIGVAPLPDLQSASDPSDPSMHSLCEANDDILDIPSSGMFQHQPTFDQVAQELSIQEETHFSTTEQDSESELHPQSSGDDDENAEDRKEDHEVYSTEQPGLKDNLHFDERCSTLGKTYPSSYPMSNGNAPENNLNEVQHQSEEQASQEDAHGGNANRRTESQSVAQEKPCEHRSSQEGALMIQPRVRGDVLPQPIQLQHDVDGDINQNEVLGQLGTPVGLPPSFILNPPEKRKAPSPSNRDPRLKSRRPTAISKRKGGNNSRPVTRANTPRAGPPIPKGSKRGPKTIEYGMTEDDETQEEIDDESDDEGNRKKIKIEYISAKRNRQVTFLKRKNGVMKKAMELGVLTGCDIAVVVHNTDNSKTFEYSSKEMEKILSNFASYQGPLERRTTEKFYDLAGSKMNVNIPSEDKRLSKSALNAANAAASRPRPYHKFDPSTRVEVVRVNGKRLSSGETAPISVLGKRDSCPKLITIKDGEMERPAKHPRISQPEEAVVTREAPLLQPKPPVPAPNVQQVQPQHHYHLQLEHQFQQHLQQRLKDHLNRQAQNTTSQPMVAPTIAPSPHPPVAQEEDQFMSGNFAEPISFSNLELSNTFPCASNESDDEPAPWMTGDAEPPMNIFNFSNAETPNSVSVPSPSVPQTEIVTEGQVSTVSYLPSQIFSGSQPAEISEELNMAAPDTSTNTEETPESVDNSQLLLTVPPVPTQAAGGEHLNIFDTSEAENAPLMAPPALATVESVESSGMSTNELVTQSSLDDVHRSNIPGLDIRLGKETEMDLGVKNTQWDSLMELTSPVSCDETPQPFCGSSMSKLLDDDDDRQLDEAVERGITGSDRWSTWGEHELFSDREDLVSQPPRPSPLPVQHQSGDADGAAVAHLPNLDLDLNLSEEESNNIGTNPVEDLFSAPNGDIMSIA